MKLLLSSKKIQKLLIFALALQTTAIIPANKFFKNLGGKIKKGIEETSNVATPKLIDSLIGQVKRLKGQFQKFGGRIITGNMPEKDKAVVLATIIAIVTLTGLVVGISLIKIKQEQETAIKEKAAEISEKTTTGIKAIFEKAKSQLQNFEDSLVSLKDCLKTGKCSQGQKQFLYGSAITVAALVLLAIGIGAGALFYKKHKDAQLLAQQQAAQAALEAQQKAAQAEQAAQKAQEAANKAQGDAKIKAEQEAARLKAEAEKAKAAEEKTRLAAIEAQSKTLFSELNNLTSQKIDAAKGAMQDYFEKTMRPVADNIFVQVRERTDSALQKAKALQEQIKTASIDAKEQIIAQVQQAINQVKQESTDFIAQLQSQKSIIDIAMEQLFNIRIQDLKPLLDKIVNDRDRIFKAIEPLSTIRLTGQINNIMQYVNTLTEQGAKLAKDWKETLQQIANRSAERSSWNPANITRWAENETDMRERQAEQYPLAAIADNLAGAYPALIESANELKLAGPGIVVASIANRVTDLLTSVSEFNTAPGSIGKLLISKDLADSIKELGQAFTKLGEDIKETLRIKPLLSEVPASSTRAVIEAIKGYTWRVGTNLPTKATGIINDINNAYSRNIIPALAALTEQKNILLSQIDSASDKIKESISKQLKDAPFKTTRYAPELFSRAVANQFSEIKPSLNQIITQAGIIVEGVAAMVNRATELGELINTAIGNGFINTEIINGLKTVNNDVNIINNALAKMKSGVSSSFNIISAQ